MWSATFTACLVFKLTCLLYFKLSGAPIVVFVSGVPESSWIFGDSITSQALNATIPNVWLPYFRSLYWYNYLGRTHTLVFLARNFFRSFFFRALFTMSTIGYGDIVPSTWGEMAYCIVFGIIATYGRNYYCAHRVLSSVGWFHCFIWGRVFSSLGRLHSDYRSIILRRCGFRQRAKSSDTGSFNACILCLRLI